MNSTKKCEFCDKRGLPLLLVRDAVAPVNAGAPVTANLPIELASPAAFYTKRILRSGYINVFDEARRSWEVYFVTNDGFLFRLLCTPGVAPVVPTKPFNCPDEGHRAVAGCITIADPSKASTIWIGFSDVMWTDTIRKRNEEAAYRLRHMTAVDVAAVLRGRNAPHHPIAQLSAVVAEYAISAAQAKKSFDGSPFPFNSRQMYCERLKKECESLQPGGALIVTVPDPAGITQELAFLMKHNSDSFIEKRPEDKRKAAASLAIDQIETAIRLQAEDTEIASAEKIANESIARNPLGHWISESTRAQTERLRDVKSAQLNHVSNNAWKRYTGKFNDPDRQLWLKGFRKDLKAFDDAYVSPLVEAHVAWMKSQKLADYFECNYDQQDIESGKVYTAALTHCLYATQDKKACSDLYEDWFKGDIADSNNLLLRAMVLNQSASIEAIKKAATLSVDGRQIPWDTLFGAHDAAIGRQKRAAQDIVANFVVQACGPIARAFNKVMDGSKAFRALIMTAGLFSGHPVVICEVSGSRKKFRERLVRQLLSANENQVSEHQMRRAVKAELRRLEIHGARVDGETKMKWIVVADESIIKTMPTNLTPQQQADWIAKSLTTVEKLDQLNLERWRSLVNKNAPKVITALVQLICFTKIVEDEEKSLAHEKADATARLYAGITAILASTADAVGSVVENRPLAGLRLGQGMASSYSKLWQIGGKIAGIGAGLCIAVLDGIKALDADAQNQVGLAWLYRGSAAIGVCLTLALAFPAALGFAAIPVIGTLIVLAIVVALIIDQVKDNPIQDWMERCPWGILKEKRYADMATEQAELMKALK